MEVSRNRPSFKQLVEPIMQGTLYLASLLSDTSKNLEDSPAWLYEGITNLLPKTNDTVNPNRPIICLSST